MVALTLLRDLPPERPELGNAMISSKQLLEKTGISRATLNNYISLGLVSRPRLARPDSDSGSAPRLGYFPEEEVARVGTIQQLKREGLSMADIAARLREESKANSSSPAAGVPSTRASGGISPASPTPSNLPPRLTLDELPYPSYMVDYSFEVVWYNDPARDQIFGGLPDLPPGSEERNLFRLAIDARGERDLSSFLQFHLSLAKGRLNPTRFAEVCRGIPASELVELQRMYADATVEQGRPVLHGTIDLDSSRLDTQQTVYASFFREGILIVLSPDSAPTVSLMDFLAHRDEVIRGLLKRRLPVLTHLAVLVADLQNSVRICSELPAEEYFELINEIWATLAPIFRKYHGTYGKHVGDGMVYYFFPQPDSNYLFNALLCAQEIKEAMRRLSKSWQLRKNWFNELYLNTGLHEGQEWLGTFQSSTSVEFVVLGDTINLASRISDFCRFGAIWASKGLVSQLTGNERSRVRFGVKRQGDDGREVFVSSSYAMVSTLADLSRDRSDKLNDIAALPITEIIDILPAG